MSRPRDALLLALLSLAALPSVLGCAPAEEPETLVVWAWSSGARGEAASSLMAEFDVQQEDLRVAASPWPEGARQGAPPSRLVAAVEAAASDRSRHPALLEVPLEALPAFVEVGLAFDVGGRLARRMGVLWEDYQPWLMPAELVVSDGVRAVPFFVEVPLVAYRAPPELGGASGAALAEALLAAAGAGSDAPRRPLAAAADHRVVLWQLREAGVDLTAPEGLGSERARAALSRAAALIGGRAVGIGEEGERRALEEVREGRAVGAWVWSSRAREIARADLRAVEASAPPRGTCLVVNARAPWRVREAAFRLARWLTEPSQSAELAARTSTIPVRQSASRSPGLGVGPSAQLSQGRDVALGHGFRLPASGAFADALVVAVEGAMARGDLGQGVLEALQVAPAPADGEGEEAR